jgi:hypothetical protein
VFSAPGGALRGAINRAATDTIAWTEEVSMTESGQLDLVDLMSDQAARAEGGLSDLYDTLNLQVDANPNDKLLMEMLDVVTDAQESMQELRDLLQTMQQRDLAEEA